MTTKLVLDPLLVLNFLGSDQKSIYSFILLNGPGAY